MVTMRQGSVYCSLADMAGDLAGALVWYALRLCKRGIDGTPSNLLPRIEDWPSAFVERNHRSRESRMFLTLVC